MNRINIPVILACEHTRLIKSSAAVTSVRCGRCFANQAIKDVITSEWHAVCKTCSYARWCGLSAMTANQMADGHARKTNHAVDVTFADNPASVRVRERLARIGALK